MSSSLASLRVRTKDAAQQDAQDAQDVQDAPIDDEKGGFRRPTVSLEEAAQYETRHRIKEHIQQLFVWLLAVRPADPIRALLERAEDLAPSREWHPADPAAHRVGPDEAEKYITEHHLHHLFEVLLTEILFNREDDPWAVLARILRSLLPHPRGPAPRGFPLRAVGRHVVRMRARSAFDATAYYAPDRAADFLRLRAGDVVVVSDDDPVKHNGWWRGRVEAVGAKDGLFPPNKCDIVQLAPPSPDDHTAGVECDDGEGGYALSTIIEDAADEIRLEHAVFDDRVQAMVDVWDVNGERCGPRVVLSRDDTRDLLGRYVAVASIPIAHPAGPAATPRDAAYRGVVVEVGETLPLRGLPKSFRLFRGAVFIGADPRAWVDHAAMEEWLLALPHFRECEEAGRFSRER